MMSSDAPRCSSLLHDHLGAVVSAVRGGGGAVGAQRVARRRHHAGFPSLGGAGAGDVLRCPALVVLRKPRGGHRTRSSPAHVLPPRSCLLGETAARRAAVAALVV